MGNGAATAKKDPGLQLERTGLAWSRTAFVLFLYGLLALRVAIVSPSLGFAGMAILAFCVSALAYALAVKRASSALAGAIPISAMRGVMSLMAFFVCACSGGALLLLGGRLIL